MAINKNKVLRLEKGFSLIEIMVGLVIGLLATLVIVNVFTVFEQQKRTTTGNSDAQTNGAIALYNFQRDVQLAGYGLPVYDTEFTPYRCPTENAGGASTIYDHDNNVATAAIGISPLVIVDGGVNGSDTIAIRTGSTARGGISKTILNLPAPNTASISNNLGCQAGDAALLVSEDMSSCRVVRVTAVIAGGTDVTFTPNLVAANGIVAGAKMACLGAWNEFRYTVNANNELTRTGSIVNGVPSTAAVALVPDIVSIQAQYGVSVLPSDSNVAQWVDATGAWSDIANVDNRNRIKAVRIAIVARNGSIQTTEVTAACSSLTANAPTGLCAWAGTALSPAPAINLADVDANWSRYRYRVYESIIPMRNVIFSRSAM